MLLCGIPKSSISVITPYKGQKTAILSALRKAKVSMYQSDYSAPAVFVSTVDRYQGDENDIVILSLVKTEPGNRFVALLNRWIVAMSRARLGFYIIGSVDAVTKFRSNDPVMCPPHWKKLVAELKNDEAETKVGSFMPICCPRHRSNKILATPFPTHNTWSQLCTKRCNFPLKGCNHDCCLPCHSPTLAGHNEKCMEKITRPCSTHFDVPILCYEARGSSSTLQEGLKRFRCNIPDNYSRPECEHAITLPCHSKISLLQGLTSLKPCAVTVSNFMRSCGHAIVKPTCAKRRSYETNEPLCLKKVTLTRRCGCDVGIRCHERTLETANPVECLVVKKVPRPRCSHVISMRCRDFEVLQGHWRADCLISVEHDEDIYQNPNILVRYGIAYGPPESHYYPTIEECKSDVDYLNRCGHVISKVPCFLTFKLATNEGSQGNIICDTDVVMISPLCGHQIKVKCCYSSIIQSWSPWNDQNCSEVEGSCSMFNENAVNKNSPLSREIQRCFTNVCGKSIQLKRLCGHHVEISCSNLFKMLAGSYNLQPCQEIVLRSLPCGHDVPVLCFDMLTEPGPFCYVPDDRIFVYPCGVHNVKPGSCGGYQTLASSNEPCPEIVNCQQYRCHHSVSISCGKRNMVENPKMGRRMPQRSLEEKAVVESYTDYCASENISPCTEKISFKMPCGHTIDNIDCYEAFEYSNDELLRPECMEIVQMQSPLCLHPISLPCAAATKLSTWDAWGPDGLPIYDEMFLDYQDHESPSRRRIIKANDRKPTRQLPDISQEYLSCNVNVIFIRDCDHSFQTQCFDVYYGHERPCENLVVEICPNCSIENKCKCRQYRGRKLRGLPVKCNNLVQKQCTVCHINYVTSKCHSEVLTQCHSKVIGYQQCGHEVSWMCGEDENPILSQKLCHGCVLPLWEAAALYEKDGDNKMALMSTLQIQWHQYLEEKILNTCDIKQKMVFSFEEQTYNNYVQARKSITDVWIHLLRNESMNITSIMLGRSFRSFKLQHSLSTSETKVGGYS